MQVQQLRLPTLKIRTATHIVHFTALYYVHQLANVLAIGFRQITVGEGKGVKGPKSYRPYLKWDVDLVHVCVHAPAADLQQALTLQRTNIITLTL
jgi:hypothetical protein